MRTKHAMSMATSFYGPNHPNGFARRTVWAFGDRTTAHEHHKADAHKGQYVEEYQACRETLARAQEEQAAKGKG